FEQVSKSFSPHKVVVKDLSFTVKQGEFFSILGPSGCGKTTCLRMISGLEKPSNGTIRMAGQIVNDVHPHKRNVHTVFQKYALFPHLNVFDNVAFGLRMKRKPEKEVKRQVERMLQMVRLEDYGLRSIQQLSGGEQQRVALVRALVNEPAILLLDEPLAALDLKLREQMQQELSMLQKRLGTTFIFVTHDQAEALTLSDRVAIMNNGQIEQVGTATEVYEQPSTAFVAKFVGTSNLFTGTLGNGTRHPVFTVNSQGYGQLYTKLDESKGPHQPQLGSSVGLIVRPEKIRIRVTAPSSPASPASQSVGLETTPPTSSGSALNVLRGTLIERTYFGPTTQIKLQIAEQLPPLIALVANQTATKMPALKMGEKYYAVWDASDSILVTTT
ncbi:MAG: ABC transporter ATP-binding protein, partial [Bdellovibrionota bacterium]